MYSVHHHPLVDLENILAEEEDDDGIISWWRDRDDDMACADWYANQAAVERYILPAAPVGPLPPPIKSYPEPLDNGGGSCICM